MTSYKPADRSTVVPRLFTKDVAGLVTFLKAAFGAKGRLVRDRPTELVIGDSVIMVSDGAGVRKPTSSSFYIYVADADRTWVRAVKAGAKSHREPEATPWGDRRAIVSDPWGNQWQIATHGAAIAREPGRKASAGMPARIRAFSKSVRSNYEARPVTKADWDKASGDED